MPTLTNEMMRQIIMDHYSNPLYKKDPTDKQDYLILHSSSDNCIDDIDVFCKVNGNIIVDCLWNGTACTISTASTDIMCGLVIGKTKEEGLKIIEEYLHMIHEEPYDEEALEEANAFCNTSKQAARIRCATIGWNALKDILEKNGKEN